MKLITYLFILILASTKCEAQALSKLDSMNALIKTNHIQINQVQKKLKGFTYYYNCDSNLFFKGLFGDTIQLYTVFAEWRLDLETLSKRVKEKSFGETTIIRRVADDGDVMAFFYGKTTMIFRNDSLFLLENFTPVPEHFYSHFDDFFSGKIDEKTFDRRDDSLQMIREKTAVYLPKFIFTKSIFNKSNEYKSPKNLNFDSDKIVLENKWKENNKTCYLIKIKNKDKDGTETSYGYAFDENMKFVWWEGCNK